MSNKHLLLVGASRGLGLAMAAEFLKTGWTVVGTVRGSARTGLHGLADEYKGRVEIEFARHHRAGPDRDAARASIGAPLRYAVRERGHRQRP